MNKLLYNLDRRTLSITTYTVVGIVFCVCSNVFAGETNKVDILSSQIQEVLSLDDTAYSIDFLEERLQSTQKATKEKKLQLEKQETDYEGKCKQFKIEPQEMSSETAVKLERLKLIRDMIDNAIEQQIYREEARSLRYRGKSVSCYSLNGLLPAKDLSSLLSLLSEAKIITVYGNLLNQASLFKVNQPISITDSGTIKSLYELIISSNFEYDSDWTQILESQRTIGTSLRMVIEIDGCAWVKILGSHHLVVENDRSYSTSVRSEDGIIFFQTVCNILLERGSRINR